MATEKSWVLDFHTTRQRWDAGTEVLLFKRKRNRQGEVPMAIRSHPFRMPLKGYVLYASGSYPGWETHPAAIASAIHYGYPRAAAAPTPAP